MALGEPKTRRRRANASAHNCDRAALARRRGKYKGRRECVCSGQMQVHVRWGGQ